MAKKKRWYNLLHKQPACKLACQQSRFGYHFGLQGCMTLHPSSLHYTVSSYCTCTDSKGYLWVSLNELANNTCNGLAGGSQQCILLPDWFCCIPVHRAPTHHESKTFYFFLSKRYPGLHSKHEYCHGVSMNHGNKPFYFVYQSISQDNKTNHE